MVKKFRRYQQCFDLKHSIIANEVYIHYFWGTDEITPPKNCAKQYILAELVS